METAEDTLAATLGRAIAGAVEPVDGSDAIARIQELETLSRTVEAAKADLLAAIDRRGLHREDGHGSAKTMVRHVGQLSGATALARLRAARMCADLTRVAAAWREGSIGSEQVHVLARTHANVRVRDEMGDYEVWFLDQARRLDFDGFKRLVADWERLIDDDGAEPNQRNHEARNARIVQQPDLSWELMASYAALQGASMREIFDLYVDAELMADWEAARAELGDAATADDLPRTPQQRRADALSRIFQDAAGADGSAVPPGFVHTIEWDEATYQEMLRRLDGDPAEPLDPATSVCETSTGHALEPLEAALCSLRYAVLRVIVDAQSVVIDQGRARCFTGSARRATKHRQRHCAWPGCRTAITVCEIDHIHDHACGGETNPGNGLPLCGRHNRWKQNGFTIRRTPTGEIHFHRRDGTRLE